MWEGSDYLVVRGRTGASGCAEVLSIVKISGTKVTFSPSLNSCGGVENVSFNSGIVTVTAWERDEENKVEYVVDGSQVTENGQEILMKFSFLSE